jgi:hypothetical protein
MGHMRTPIVSVVIWTLNVLPVAQAQAPLVNAPTGTQTLAATLKVYAFPGAGQPATQQSKDETECYNWAVKETGNDPFHVANQSAQQQQEAAQKQQQAAQQQEQAKQSTTGSGTKGAVRGAAGGAAIGALAGNAGKGAAIGATAGLVAGRAKAEGKAQQGQQQAQQAQQQAAQQSEAAAKMSAEKVNDFKKAFSACLEAKKYTVKY